MRRLAGVLTEEKQLRGIADGGPAAQAGMAGPEKARPVMLRQSGAVLAVTTGFDPSAPNTARVYDHWRGGKDAFPVDRAEADQLLAINPPLRDMVRENRAFVTEAAGWAAGQGISQFIDLGAGLPASPSVHQVAREVIPTARIAYVDIDSVVLSHARALLATRDGVTAVAADLRDPARSCTSSTLTLPAR
jgi:hypothetical protein